MNAKIEVLNRFMGREPFECRDKKDDCGGWIDGPHHVPHLVYYNPYANTPEAREWTRKLKDEFVRRTRRRVDSACHEWDGQIIHDVWIGFRGQASTRSIIEHHAILDAIYEAIK